MRRYGSVLAAVLLVAVAFVIEADAQKCRDFDEDTCEEHAAHGYCMYRDIQKKCPESCGLCKHSKKPGQSRCEDFDEDTCEEHAENGNCKYWEVQQSCPDSCDLCPDENTSSTTATKGPSPSPIDTPFPTPSSSPSCFSHPTEICIAVNTSSRLKPKRRFVKDTVKAIEKTFGVFGTRFAGVAFGKKVHNSTPRFVD